MPQPTPKLTFLHELTLLLHKAEVELMPSDKYLYVRYPVFDSVGNRCRVDQDTLEGPLNAESAAQMYYRELDNLRMQNPDKVYTADPMPAGLEREPGTRTYVDEAQAAWETYKQTHTFPRNLSEDEFNDARKRFISDFQYEHIHSLSDDDMIRWRSYCGEQKSWLWGIVEFEHQREEFFANRACHLDDISHG